MSYREWDLSLPGKTSSPLRAGAQRSAISTIRSSKMDLNFQIGGLKRGFKAFKLQFKQLFKTKLPRTVKSLCAKGQHATYTESLSKPVECFLFVCTLQKNQFSPGYNELQMYAKSCKFVFFYVIAFKHLFLKLISNSILNTHSSLQKKAKAILHVQYIFSTFFYIRKEKSLLAEIFHIIYFLVSILILVLKEMLSCRITCNLGIYLQKLYRKTCTFPLSSRVLPKPAPLTPQNSNKFTGCRCITLHLLLRG